MESEKITVLVVDDHAVVREGIADALAQSGDFAVLGQAGDGATAVKLVEELSPDVVVMDILMSGMDGVEACRAVVALGKGTKVMMLTASRRQNLVVDAVDAGAVGYLQKFSNQEMLLAALRDVASGEFRLQGEVVQGLVTGLVRGRNASVSDLGVLTPRERDVLRMFAEGMGYAEIGEARGNTPMSVRNVVYNIKKKLGVNTRQELGVWAARSGLLDEE